MEDVAAFAQHVRIRRPDVSLQAYEGGVNAVEERQHRSEWNRSVVIVRMSRAARPGEADAAPAGRAEARFPVNDGLWIGAQIWRCGWKSRKPSGKGEGQTQKRAVQIEVGQRAAARYHLGRSGEGSGEFAQRVLHLQDDPRPTRGNERDVSAELDRVAKSLLGMEQDGFAGDIRCAKPQGPVECAPVTFHLRCPPAPLVLLPAGFEVPDQKPA